MSRGNARWKGFVEGGSAAMLAGAVTHPLDLIKVRMQLQGAASLATAHSTAQLSTAGIGGGAASMALPHGAAAALQGGAGPRLGPLGVGMRVIEQEGALALLNGVSATVLRQGVYSSTRFGIYEVIRTSWSEPAPSLGRGGGGGGSEAAAVFPLHKKVAAGLFSGAVGAAVGNPADLAMVRMQADGRLPEAMRRNYSSAGDAIARIVREEGVLSLWRGCGPTVQRAMVVTAAQLATYDQAKEALVSNRILKDGFGAHITASLMAGLVASVTSNPLDVIKTRLMDMKTPPGQKPMYAGALDCAIKTTRAEGPMALYKGFIPTVTRQGPFTVVLFLSLEQIRKLTAAF
eukprot:jgi/Mesen1/3282/ME000019S02692